MTPTVPPVTRASIEAAILARDAERIANGIVCDDQGRIVCVTPLTMRRSA